VQGLVEAGAELIALAAGLAIFIIVFLDLILQILDEESNGQRESWLWKGFTTILFLGLWVSRSIEPLVYPFGRPPPDRGDDSP